MQPGNLGWGNFFCLHQDEHVVEQPMMCFMKGQVGMQVSPLQKLLLAPVDFPAVSLNLAGITACYDNISQR